MRLKRLFLPTFLLLLFSSCCIAGAGSGATLKGRSQTGKVSLIIKTRDVGGTITVAQLAVAGSDTVYLDRDFDVYDITDLPNHILTMCFRQRGVAADVPDALWVKIWGIPSSFVKMVNSDDSNWRFTMKVSGSMWKEVTKIDCTYEWKP